MRELWVMTVTDVRQRARDRTVVIFSLLVPLGLMAVFHLVFGGSEDVQLEPATVVLDAPAADPLADALVEALDTVSAFDVHVERASAPQSRERAEAGAADLAVLVPPDFGAALRDGKRTDVRVVEGDGSGLEADILEAVVDGTVTRLAAVAEAARAGAMAGVPHGRLLRIGEQMGEHGGPQITLAQGRAANEQLSPGGALVAGQAGLFLLFTVGFGVLSLLAERDQGTLARLRSMPIQPALIVTAKVLSGFVLGTLATTVLLVAGALLFGVDFGSPPAVAAVILSTVAAATSLTFVVARVARTAEQANVAQAIIAMMLGVLGGAFFPLTASGVAGRLLDLNPVAALGRGLGITAGGGGLNDIAVTVLSMVCFVLVCLVVARLLPDRGGTT